MIADLEGESRTPTESSPPQGAAFYVFCWHSTEIGAPANDVRFWHFWTCRGGLTTSAARGRAEVARQRIKALRLTQPRRHRHRTKRFRTELFESSFVISVPVTEPKRRLQKSTCIQNAIERYFRFGQYFGRLDRLRKGAVMRLKKICFVHGLALLMGFVVSPVNALVIIDNFDSTITNNANAATIESAIQSASNTISSLFDNPVTVNILFEFNPAILGQTTAAGYINSYAAYTSLLQANATSNPANSTLATAVAHLGSGNGAIGLPIYSTSANLRALGVTTALGTLNSSGVTSPSGTYDAIVSIGNLSYSSNGPGFNSQGVGEVEHLINEVLGGGGSGSTLGTSKANMAFGGLDLYRYALSGSGISSITSTPSYTTSFSAGAAFSVDGGATGIVQFNQAGAGSDYGDFANVGPCQIQAAFNCGPSPVYSTTSPEFLMMESLGFDPVTNMNAVPEPST
jgi:hypothetical protein